MLWLRNRGNSIERVRRWTSWRVPYPRAIPPSEPHPCVVQASVGLGVNGHRHESPKDVPGSQSLPGTFASVRLGISDCVLRHLAAQENAATEADTHQKQRAGLGGRAGVRIGKLPTIDGDDRFGDGDSPHVFIVR
jgi:hypothetical protein